MGVGKVTYWLLHFIRVNYIRGVFKSILIFIRKFPVILHVLTSPSFRRFERLDLFLEAINKFILLDLFSIQIRHRAWCQRHGDFTQLMSMGHGFGLLLPSQLWGLSAPVLLWHKQLQKITTSTHDWRTGVQSLRQQRTGTSWHDCAEVHKRHSSYSTVKCGHSILVSIVLNSYE